MKYFRGLAFYFLTQRLGHRNMQASPLPATFVAEGGEQFN
jgi:hypothetical protein